MNNTTTVENLYTKRIVTYWLARAVGYIFPLLYFFITAGIQQQATKWVIPTLIAGVFLVIKFSMDIKSWTRSWKPSFWKGMLLAVPKIILFFILMALGLILKNIIEEQIDAYFYTYFESVIVLFGSQAIGGVIEAFHLKYYELDLIDKGFVLGVVNK